MAKNRPPVFKMMFTVLFALVALFGAFVAVALLWATGFGAGLIALFALVYVDFVLCAILLAWAPNLLKRLYYIPVVIAVAGAAGLGWGMGRTAYEPTVAVIAEQPPDLRQYKPHSAAPGLARLEGEPSLSLVADLPRLDCAAALYPVMAAFVEAVYPPGDYPFDEPGGLFYQTGEAVAYSRLIKGEVDIILASDPTDAQILAAEAAGVTLRLTPIGKEAFVFFTHSNNPVESLTVTDIRGIYSGHITAWRDVGGRSEAIRAYQRPQNSGSQATLLALMGDVPATQRILEETPEGMRTAAYQNYPNALGFAFRWHTQALLQAGEIKLLGLDGLLPTAENIRSGLYPVATKFYAVTAGSDNPNVQPFIDWMTSAEGQTLVEESGYVALRNPAV